MMRALWWIKKDFRLGDNPALTAALAQSESVTPVFLFEPKILRAEETSAFHVAAWCEALGDLRRRLIAHGADVLVLEGDAPEALRRLRRVLPFDALWSHQETGTELTYARDRAVGAWAKDVGVAWHEELQTGVFRGPIDRNKRHRTWKTFMGAGPIQPPDAQDLARLKVPPEAAALALRGPLTPERFGHPLTTIQRECRQVVSEAAAKDTLRSFLDDRGLGYSGGISSPNSAFTHGSRLSVHFAWGTLTGREAYAATEARRAELGSARDDTTKRWRKSLKAFSSRLHWRDQFTQRLETEPQMEFEPLNPAYVDLPTPGDPHFEQWLEGQTGWPLVDACMRCTAQTGFLNFRMRAMVTSVAVHTLRIDWRKLVYPVARIWADYEPGIHVSQTQMQAGVVGINQLRAYSPDKQLLDQDPEARFVRRWVPELAHTPAEAILRHPLHPLPNYPVPPVDRQASLRAFKVDYFAIKRRPETRALAQTVYEKHGSRRAASQRTWKSNTPRKTSKD